MSAILNANLNNFTAVSFEQAFGEETKKTYARMRLVARHGRFIVFSPSRHAGRFDQEKQKLVFKISGCDYWLCELRPEYLVTSKLLGEEPLVYHLRDKNIVWKQYVGGMSGGFLHRDRVEAYEKRRNLILEQADVLAKHLSKYKVNPLSRELERRRKCQSRETKQESKR